MTEEIAFMLVWSLTAGPVGWVLAFDYRGAAQRLFEITRRTTPWDPGDALSYRFFQLLGGMFGVAACVMLPAALVKWTT